MTYRNMRKSIKFYVLWIVSCAFTLIVMKHLIEWDLEWPWMMIVCALFYMAREKMGFPKDLVNPKKEDSEDDDGDDPYGV